MCWVNIANSTLFTVLISELLIKTRACLSGVSCQLDCSCSAKALFRLLSGQTFSLMWKRKQWKEKKGSVLALLYMCLECITLFTAAQTLIYRQSRLTSYYWMNTRCTVTRYTIRRWLSEHKTSKICFLTGLKALFQCVASFLWHLSGSAMK